jgi:hypothetical protein
MPQDYDWRKYVVNNPDSVELFLRNGTHPDGRIWFEGLMHRTDMRVPPTCLWYKLHLISVTCTEVQTIEHLWPPDVVAWGLNIWECDLLKLYRRIMDKLASHEGSGTCTSIYYLMESALSCMPSRFADFPGEEFEWRLRALSQMTIACWRAYNNAKARDFYDKMTGVWTELGIENWRDMLAQADHNDRAHGFPTVIGQHKRKVEGESQLDRDGHSSKRNKKMQDTTSMNKRQLPGNNGDEYHGPLNVKRIKTAHVTDPKNKRSRDEDNLIEEGGHTAKRQVFGR